MQENVAANHPVDFAGAGSGSGDHPVAGPRLAGHSMAVYRILPRRGAALLIDSILWAIPIVVLALTVGRTTEPVFVDTADGFALSEQMTFHLSSLLIWGVTIVWFAYLVLAEWRFGATLGKKACGIAVVGEDGTSVEIRAVAIRQAPRFAIVSLLSLLTLYWLVPLVFLVEALVAQTGDRRQRVGDRLAETVVVRVDLIRMAAASPLIAGGWLPIEAAPPPIPEGVLAAGYGSYAGFGQRAVAVVFDGIVVAIIISILNEFLAATSWTTSLFAFQAETASESFGPVSSASDWRGLAVMTAVGFGYYAYFNGRGATPGKLLFGIRVVDAAGRAPGIRKGAIRQLIPMAGAFVPFLVEMPMMVSLDGGRAEDVLLVLSTILVISFACFLVGVYDGLSMLWNDHRQTIHDRMAGTFVMEKAIATIEHRPG